MGNVLAELHVSQVEVSGNIYIPYSLFLPSSNGSTWWDDKLCQNGSSCHYLTPYMHYILLSAMRLFKGKFLYPRSKLQTGYGYKYQALDYSFTATITSLKVLVMVIDAPEHF